MVGRLIVADGRLLGERTWRSGVEQHRLPDIEHDFPARHN
jgi:hypothetical protein